MLNKGAVVNGDLILGVANVDLIYAKLSVLLAAFDRVTTDPLSSPLRPAHAEDHESARANHENAKTDYEDKA